MLSFLVMAVALAPPPEKDWWPQWSFPDIKVEQLTPELRHQLRVAVWTNYLCGHPELVPAIREALPAAERNKQYLDKWYPGSVERLEAKENRRAK